MAGDIAGDEKRSPEIRQAVKQDGKLGWKVAGEVKLRQRPVLRLDEDLHILTAISLSSAAAFASENWEMRILWSSGTN